MALYWRLRSVPELKGLPGDVRRWAARWMFNKAAADHRLDLPLCIMLVVAFLTGLAGAVFSGFLDFYQDVQWWDIPAAIASFLLGLAVGLAIALPIILARLRPYLREFLMTGI